MAGLTPKADYRYKYFRETYNTVTTLTSGIVVVSIAFVANLHKVSTHKFAFSIGLGSLLISLTFQILILLANAIGAGFNWDFFSSGYLDQKSDRLAQLFGKLSGNLLILSIILTTVGFIFLGYFLSVNI